MSLTAEIKRGGTSITEERIKRGKSMSALSESSGLSVAAISKMERGVSRSVRPLTAQKICDGLGVEFNSLFELVDYERSPKDER
ncbi:MAG: helix-turn-helix domain-containing protein [Clostridiales bacterium]|nr:helix-turn-helix domain-containing protein [Clostridiales bacterium]